MGMTQSNHTAWMDAASRAIAGVRAAGGDGSRFLPAWLVNDPEDHVATTCSQDVVQRLDAWIKNNPHELNKCRTRIAALKAVWCVIGDAPTVRSRDGSTHALEVRVPKFARRLLLSGGAKALADAKRKADAILFEHGMHARRILVDGPERSVERPTDVREQPWTLKIEMRHSVHEGHEIDMVHLALSEASALFSPICIQASVPAECHPKHLIGRCGRQLSILQSGLDALKWTDIVGERASVDVQAHVDDSRVSLAALVKSLDDGESVLLGAGVRKKISQAMREQLFRWLNEISLRLARGQARQEARKRSASRLKKRGGHEDSSLNCSMHALAELQCDWTKQRRDVKRFRDERLSDRHKRHASLHSRMQRRAKNGSTVLEKSRQARKNKCGASTVRASAMDNLVQQCQFALYDMYDSHHFDDDLALPTTYISDPLEMGNHIHNAKCHR